MTGLVEAHAPLSGRGPGIRSSVNDRLIEAILRHRHFVLRIENSVARDLVAPLRDAQRSILAELTRLAARDDALSNFASFRRASLIEAQRRIREALLFAEAQAISAGAERFRAFADREIAFQNRLLRSSVPGAIALDLLGPSPGQVEALLLEPLGGTRWASRMHERYGRTLVDMRTALGTSVILGEGMPQAATRIQAIAKVTRRQAVVLARSEIQRVANSAATATYMRNQDVIKGLLHVSTFDARTCFPADTLVLTPTGEVPIQDVRPGDLVIGKSGRPKRVTAMMRKRHVGAMVGLHIGGRWLWSTKDHRIATPAGWEEAGGLQVQNEVVAFNDIGDPPGGRSVRDLGFLDPHNGHAERLDLSVPPSVLRGVGVPVGAVRFDSESLRGQEEINRPPTDLNLLPVRDAEIAEDAPYVAFQARLPGECPVAPERAEPPPEGNPALHGPVLLSASVAHGEYRGASARLGTVAPISPPTSAEPCPASLARYARDTTTEAAPAVAVGDGLVDGKGFPATYAGLLNPSLGAFAATIDPLAGLLLANLEIDSTAWTGLCDPDRSAAGVVTGSRTEGAEVLAAPGEEVAALAALLGPWHVLNITARADLTDVVIDVYDIQVDDDQSFVAEGVLVHNCLICGSLDGTFYAMGESLPALPVHAQCRCFRSPVVRSFEEMGMDPLAFPASTRASMNGQVPASLTYEEWFASQSSAFQLDVLGPGRFERFRRGDVRITSFVRDLRVLRIGDLPMPSLN